MHTIKRVHLKKDLYILIVLILLNFSNQEGLSSSHQHPNTLIHTQEAIMMTVLISHVL